VNFYCKKCEKGRKELKFAFFAKFYSLIKKKSSGKKNNNFIIVSNKPIKIQFASSLI
jgi:hypothetical protein